MNKSQIISIKTTASCQLRCDNCIAVPWMQANKFWYMLMDDVMKFVHTTIDSKYHFKMIVLTGGEPLLWDNLLPALKMIKQSKITDRIKILTNSIQVNEYNLDWIEEIVSFVDIIRISRYIGNDKSIKTIKKYFRANPKIHIVDKTEFAVYVKKPFPKVLPALCTCGYPTVFGDKIYSCGSMKFLSIINNIQLSEKLFVPIKRGYLELLESKGNLKFNQKVCSYCSGNKKVLKLLDRKPNYCLEKKDEASSS